jgi:DNA replication and repair protein RecF
MYLNTVEVFGYRNLQGLSLELEGQHAAFIGPNGAGKTNLLEAIYFALKARPFRPFVQKEDLFMRTSQYPAAPLCIRTRVYEEGGRHTVLECHGEFDKKRFSFLRNEKKATSGDLAFRFPVIVFSPQDHELIRGGPEVRRGFLDQVFSDICPGYYEVYSQFEKSLKQRNKLLKKIADGENSPVELKSWNEVFLERAFQLHTLKKEVFPEFVHHFFQLCGKLGDAFYSEISLELLSSVKNYEDLKVQIEKDLPKDLATRWTHSGPHRDDLLISVYGQKSRTTASQGQGRILGLLLRWTHAQWIQAARQERALFLLDDFSSELDETHRGALLASIFSESNQVLWSATEVPRNEAIHELFKHSKLFSISNGSLKHESLINSVT